MTDPLSVTVDRVLYPPETDEDARWFILACTDSTGSQIVCKGEMGWRPRQGERLAMEGSYGTYQGKREYKFQAAALDIPTDARGMLHYVCEMASGIGPAMEDQIWNAKGEDWANVEDGEIPRLSGRVYHNLMDAIEVAEQDRIKGKAIAELIHAGCSMNMASAAWEVWEKNTLGVVMNNPYRLAELPGYGFVHVDGDIRAHYGITDDDPRRIRAAVVYVLRQITGTGSTVVQWNILHAACVEKLRGYSSLIVEQVREMFGEGTLKGFKESKNVSLAGDYKNELTIWEYLGGKAS